MDGVEYSSHNTLPLLGGTFKGQDILSLDQFSSDDLSTLFALTNEMKRIVQHNEPTHILAGYLVALLFFEPSSRTFSSFVAAVKRLGGQTIELQNPETVSSIAKGESFEDTIRMFEAYADTIVLRHPTPHSAHLAAEVASSVPVINAGDGNNEHPTQTLLDLYTLYEQFGRLDGLTGLLAGDALNSRTIHSLIRGLALFAKNRVYILAPSVLRMPTQELALLRAKGIEVIEIAREEEIPQDCDFWYWTRVQKERLASLSNYEEILSSMVTVTPQLLRKYARADMIVMDPLPRVNSVDPAVDTDARAVYLRSQIRNGLYTRMALLALILGKV